MGLMDYRTRFYLPALGLWLVRVVLGEDWRV